MNKVRELDSDIIDREIEKAFHRANGLTMLDFRTGSGKSYDLEKNIARYIYNSRHGIPLIVGETEEERHPIEQIIVLIPNKNNFLKHDSLAKKLQEVSHGEYSEQMAAQVAKEEMFIMKNNLDCIIDGFSIKKKDQFIWDDSKVEEVKNNIIKANIFSASEFKDFKNNIDEIQCYAQCKNNPILKKYINAADKSAHNAENNIRHLFHSKIETFHKLEKNKKLSKSKKKEAKEKKDSCIQIVKSFFEIANYNNYRVIVTTVDKFMYSIDPIVSFNINIWDRSFLKDKFVIIDESDSAYVRMRDSIISWVNENTYPFKEQIKELISFILESTPTRTVENAIKMAFNKKNKRYSFENLQKRSRAISKKYELTFAYKTDVDTLKDGNMPALLNDGTLCTLNEGKKYIHSIYTKEKSQVLLSVGNGPDDKLDLAPGDKEIDFAGFINDGKKLIRDFGYFLLAVTRSYQQFLANNKPEQTSGDKSEASASFSDSLECILNMLSMKKSQQKFYINLCMNLKSKPKRVNILDVDSSCYCRGYSLQLFQDNERTSRENSIIYSHDMYVMPESILLAMCQATHVLCLSATALNRSVDENFDIAYLEDKLTNFYTVSEETQKALREFYSYKEMPYAEDKGSIDVTTLPKNSDVINKDTPEEQSAAEIALPAFKNNDIKEQLLYFISQQVKIEKKKVPKRKQDIYGIYVQGRYLNLLHGLYDFIADSTMKSMVVLEKASAKDGGSLDLDLIQKMVRGCCNDIGLSEEVGLVSAVADDFDAKVKEIKEQWWELGKKAIFMSTYQTTSKGSNLQYKIPENPAIRENLITLLPEYAKDKRFEKKYDYKDIDCLYLGNYSYLLALIEGDSLKERTECFHHVIYEIQKLAELGQISYRDKRLMEEYAYKRVLNPYSDEYPQNRKKLEQTEGISNTINKILKQSVGRIDRVNQKNRVTKIFIASENLEHIDLYELERTSKDLIPAMKAIWKAAIAYQGGYNPENAAIREENRFLRLAEKKHLSAAKHFYRLFNTARSEEPKTRDRAIAEYDRIRKLTLKYPVVTEECYSSLSKEERDVVKRYYIDTHRNDVSSYVYTYDPKEFERVKDKDKCNITLAGFNVSAKGCLVVEANTTLQKALSVNGMKTIFERKGYCTAWKPGRYILTPKGIDIYNGILGEEIEKIILQDIINEVELARRRLDIHEINDELPPEIFERFDFMYGNLYIDAKNWRRGVQKWNARDFIDHVKEKRDLCDDFYKQKGIAVVLNLYPESSTSFKDVVYTDDRYVEIRRLINDDGSVNEEAKYTLFRLFMETNEYAHKNKHN